MAAIKSVAHPGVVMHEISKRSNWAGRNAGVVVVFCIVFIVAVGLIALWIGKFIKRRKDAKPEM